MNEFGERDAALFRLHAQLCRDGYRFVTSSPASHARVLKRPGRNRARSLTDVFGWSIPFEPGLLSREMLEWLRTGGMLDEGTALHRSRVRLSHVGPHAYFHSAFPTEGSDAVFLGPDSHRFADLIASELIAEPAPPGARIVDIGVGAGVGAISAADLSPGATITATDPNPHALRLARINAARAGVPIDFVETSGLAGVAGPFDLVLLNPPYIVDANARTYRDGGGMHGGQLSLDLATEALAKLAAGGRLILYTGSAILDGRDPLRDALAEAARAHGCAFRYREIDPDMFGEELDEPAYADVDRIAVVAAVFTRRA